jgi:hypothetical protein
MVRQQPLRDVRDLLPRMPVEGTGRTHRAAIHVG